jgi:hypothetical protein
MFMDHANLISIIILKIIWNQNDQFVLVTFRILKKEENKKIKLIKNKFF